MYHYAPFSRHHLATARQIYRRAIKAVGDELYSPVQKNAWAAFASHEQFAQFVLHPINQGCFLENKLIAFCSWDFAASNVLCKRTHVYIQCLYVDPQYARQGIGKALVRGVFTSQPTQKVFTAYASMSSKKLFENCGFRVLYEESVVRMQQTLNRFAMRCVRVQ